MKVKMNEVARQMYTEFAEILISLMKEAPPAFKNQAFKLSRAYWPTDPTV
jgi:hypothetical protein